MNSWLIEDEDEPLEHEASDKEVDSDLESTASKMAINLQSGPNNNNNNNENLDIATIIAQQLRTILPQIVTQVTNNVNNANGRKGRNGGNEGNNGCTYKGFIACNPKEYDGKGGAIALTRWIEKMENVINNSGCTENQKKLESEFWNHKMVGANHAGYTDRFHELAKLVSHLVTHESSRIKRVMRKERELKSQVSKVVEEMNIRGRSFVNPGYLIEVADGMKVEVDRVICNCKLELGTSLFSIDLIPLGHGSFDVIVWMDWLSEHKAEIVCHEKMEKRKDGSLYFLDHIWVPLVGGVQTIIMDETYKTRYFVHPRADKMYYDIRNMYWWPGMKRDIAIYVSKCLTCSKVKAEHQRPSGLLQQPEIPEWKWDKITMDFITKLPRQRWMVYIAMLADCTKGFMDEVGYEYGVPSPNGWQSERTIQTLEDMLRAEIRESSLIGPELIQEMTDKVVLIKEKLKAARDRQKSYADNRRKSLEFEVGDRVMLKVLPWKGVIRFGKKGPFEILERIGHVAYRLRYPEELSGVHDTFPVSNLKKCLANASLHVPMDDIRIDKTLRFVEEPIEIMDHEVKRLKRSRISLVKVRWNSKRGPKFTWERENFMKSKYPQLFVDRADEKACLNLEMRFPKGGDTMITMT
nr:putative reverse transcriptase domain-containing protein [Tanacetum cinerariifolium]